ncbi:MAG: hypothetical protein ACYDCC_05145 [Actinomycetota bacterium]
MQPIEDNQKRTAASRPASDSFHPVEQEIDLKLVEALERIERVRSKALAALGNMISAH